MNAQSLHDLCADREHRVESGHRLLKNETDLSAADGAHVALAQLEEIAAAVEADRAPIGFPRRLNQPQDRQRRHRLAAAGFADDSKRLAPAQLQADAIDCPNHATARNFEGCREVLDPKKDGVAHLSSRGLAEDVS